MEHTETQEPVTFKELIENLDLIAAWSDPTVIDQFFLNNSLDFVGGNNVR